MLSVPMFTFPCTAVTLNKQAMGNNQNFFIVDIMTPYHQVSRPLSGMQLPA